MITLNTGDPTRVFDLGFADQATPRISSDATVSGTVFRDTNGDGRSEVGEGGKVGLDGVFVDTNYNGRLDPDEARAYLNVGQSYILIAPIAPFALRSIRDGALLARAARSITTRSATANSSATARTSQFRAAVAKS